MKKKTKSNLFNEFEEKVLSGGNYAYIYDKEDSSLTDAAFNVFSDINDWKAETLDGSPPWVYPYYPTTTGTVTTTSPTVTPPYYSEETFEGQLPTT